MSRKGKEVLNERFRINRAQVEERKNYEYSANVKDGALHVNIYEDIGWYGVNSQNFAGAIAGHEDKELVIMVNSYGGDSFEGRSISNIIKMRDTKTTAITTGLAASAAATIFMSADVRLMMPQTEFLVHRNMLIVDYLQFANANDMRALVSQMQGRIEELDKSDEAVAQDYANATGMSKDDVISLMDEDRFMTADEAIEKGFAQGYYEKESKQENKTQAPPAAETNPVAVANHLRLLMAGVPSI